MGGFNLYLGGFYFSLGGIYLSFGRLYGGFGSFYNIYWNEWYNNERIMGDIKLKNRNFWRWI